MTEDVKKNSFTEEKKAIKVDTISEDNSEVYDYDNPNNYDTVYVDEFNPNGLRYPTPEEKKKLRRILQKIPRSVFFICLIELAERASYYSTSGLISNFVQRPLPEGSTTGAVPPGNGDTSAGALNLGLRTATALNLVLQFFAYAVPLFSGYLADTRIGKLKCLWVGIIAGVISHILFIIASIPSVLANGKAALAPTILAILTLCLSTGFIKPSLLPFVMSQFKIKKDVVKVLPTGEKVIIDCTKSYERMTLVYYWIINVGAFFSLATSYCSRIVGFWLGFLVPMFVFMLLPPLLYFVGRRTPKEEVHGSVITNFLKVIKLCFLSGWVQRYKKNQFWEYAKPHNIKTAVSWKEQDVLDYKQTIQACKIFLYYPIYLVNIGGLATSQTSQTGSMSLNGVPNDLFWNFNPLTIIVLLPILNNVVYPMLRKYKIDFKPVYRITIGFTIAALAQAAGAVIQYYIYETSPCGYNATNCQKGAAPISAWVEVTLYCMQATSECFANVTSYELAYTRSPTHLKSLVMAICLFMHSFSAALSQIVTPALKDPNVIWAFTAMAVTGIVFTVIFFIHFRNLHVTMEQERIDKEAAERDEFQKLEAVTSIRSVVGK